jgi:uncharacterized protein YejL (UPF0352 family)
MINEAIETSEETILKLINKIQVMLGIHKATYELLTIIIGVMVPYCESDIVCLR